MSNKKTFYIFSDDSVIKVGSKITLRVDRTSFWCINNTIAKSDTNPGYAGAFTFVVYCSGKKAGDVITVNDNISLYCTSKNSYWAKVGTSDLGFDISNNIFMIASDDLPQKAQVTSGSAVFFKQGALVISVNTSTGKMICTGDYDDGHVGPNHPFMFVKFWDYWTRNRDRFKLIGYTFRNTGSAVCTTTMWRIAPPPGYVNPGDFMFSRPQSSGRNKDDITPHPDYEGSVTLVFVKEQSDDPNKPFAKLVPESKMQLLGGYTPNTNSTLKADCWFGDDTFRNDKPSIRLLQGTILDGGEYIPVGCCLTNDWTGIKPLIYALNKDLLQNTSGTPYNEQFRTGDVINRWYYDGGRKLAGSDDLWKYCDFHSIATTVAFNRSGKSLTEPTNGIFTHLFYGFAGSPGGDWVAATDKLMKNTQVYILFTEQQKQACCRGNNLGRGECGFGMDGLIKNSRLCTNFAQNLCVATNPEFTSAFCQDDYCKSDPASLNQLNCDDQYSKFCNMKVIENGVVKYPNYYKYPDLCSCFMDQQFMTPLCNDMAKSLGINKNKTAMKALSLDTSDPQQCIQPCRVIPMCRKGAAVGRGFNPDRYNKSVIQGAASQKGSCDSISLCVQDVTVNNEGSIGSLNIQQSANCPAIQRKCIVSDDPKQSTVVFSSCTIRPSTNMFQKRITDEKEQECGILNQIFDCASFDLKTWTDACKDGVRAITVRQLDSKASNRDIMDAFFVLLREDPAKANILKWSKSSLRLMDLYRQNVNLEGSWTFKDTKGNISTFSFQKRIGNTSKTNHPSGDLTYTNEIYGTLQPVIKLGSYYGLVTLDRNGQPTTIAWGTKVANGYNMAGDIYTVTGPTFNTLSDIQIDSVLRMIPPYQLTPLDFELSTSFAYDPQSQIISAFSICQDCEVAEERSGACFLDKNKWKLNVTRTKVVTQPYNQGKSCDMVRNTNPIVVDCPDDKDCKLVASSVDKGCIDGTKEYSFKVTEFGSGKGKTCEQSALALLPKDVAAQNPIFSVSPDQTELTASISCEDCEVGYRVEPGTICTKQPDGSFKLKKMPYMKREATGGGKCPVDKLKIVSDKVPLLEACTLNQDCTFNVQPDKDVCDDTTGTRTMTFSVKQPAMGTGKVCDVAAIEFSRQYTTDASKVKFTSANNILTVTTECEKRQDCVLNFDKPVNKSCDHQTGLYKRSFEINTFPVGRGLRCDEVVKQRIPTAKKIDTNAISVDVFTEDEGACPKQANVSEAEKQEIMDVLKGLAIFMCIVILVQIIRSKPAEEMTNEETSSQEASSNRGKLFGILVVVLCLIGGVAWLVDKNFSARAIA